MIRYIKVYFNILILIETFFLFFIPSSIYASVHPEERICVVQTTQPSRTLNYSDTTPQPTVCPICINDIEKNYVIICRNKHRVHKDCFKQIKNHNISKCPLCRTHLINKHQTIEVKNPTAIIYTEQRRRDLPQINFLSTLQDILLLPLGLCSCPSSPYQTERTNRSSCSSKAESSCIYCIWGGFSFIVSYALFSFCPCSSFCTACILPSCCSCCCCSALKHYSDI